MMGLTRRNLNICSLKALTYTHAMHGMYFRCRAPTKRKNTAERTVYFQVMWGALTCVHNLAIRRHYNIADIVERKDGNKGSLSC